LTGFKSGLFGGNRSGFINVDHAISQCRRRLDCDVRYFTRSYGNT